MSGVMVKIGIFGILKVAMDLLAQTGLPLWWGTLVMAIGAISALLGVLYALAEQDIKRLLAWSTVENVGIILLAVGVAMDGLSLHDPLLTVVGLLGALFHLLNHALFKGLLFLGAGAIISRLHTHDMEKMGALAKRMPWTAAACLIGCLAISAIPPLNGFISEWYTWQSLFSLSRVEAVALQLAGPIAMVMLAVTGGLAVMCFVKMYGITFCGAPRSTHAEEAQEVPNTMIVAMLLLAALCVLIALSASWLAPKIMHIAHAFTNTPPVTVASGIALVPRHVSYTGHPLITVAVTTGDAFAAWPLLAVVSFAPRSVSSHRRCLGMRLRLGKCDGPVRQWRDAAAACGLFCAISSTTTVRPYAEAK